MAQPDGAGSDSDNDAETTRSNTADLPCPLPYYSIFGCHEDTQHGTVGHGYAEGCRPEQVTHEEDRPRYPDRSGREQKCSHRHRPGCRGGDAGDYVRGAVAGDAELSRHSSANPGSATS